jgi:hypothetical protein
MNDCPLHNEHFQKAMDNTMKIDIEALINVTQPTAVWGAMRAIGLGADAKKTVERLINGSFDDYNIHEDAGFTEEELKKYGFKGV